MGQATNKVVKNVRTRGTAAEVEEKEKVANKAWDLRFSVTSSCRPFDHGYGPYNVQNYLFYELFVTESRCSAVCPVSCVPAPDWNGYSKVTEPRREGNRCPPGRHTAANVR